MADAGFKSWITIGASLVTILAAAGGLFLWLKDQRALAIEKNRATLANAWTNEGDVTGTDYRFMDICFSDSDGDIIGSMSSPQTEVIYDLAVDVGWQSSTVKILELRGNSIVEIGEASIKVTGNNNRLKWKIRSGGIPKIIPEETILWPNSMPDERLSCGGRRGDAPTETPHPR